MIAPASNLFDSATLQRPTLSLAELEAFDPHPSGRGDERRFCCPLPGCRDKPVDRAHQSLCLNSTTGAWVCWRCQTTGKVTECWTDRSARPFREVRRATALRSLRVQPDPQPGTAETAAVLPERLAACRPLAGTPGEAYLRRRGIGLDLATAAGVRFSSGWSARPDGRRAAVVFVLHDQAGRVVAANGRYLTVPEGLTKTLVLGDLRLGVFATPGAFGRGPLVLVEGPMDALALAAVDVPAVALGTTRAPHWLRVAAAFREVLLALDADAAGDAGAAALQTELTPFARTVQRMRPRVGKDWNDWLQTAPVSLRRAVARLRTITLARTYDLLERSEGRPPDNRADSARLSKYDRAEAETATARLAARLYRLVETVGIATDAGPEDDVSPFLEGLAAGEHGEGIAALVQAGRALLASAA